MVSVCLDSVSEQRLRELLQGLIILDMLAPGHDQHNTQHQGCAELLVHLLAQYKPSVLSQVGDKWELRLDQFKVAELQSILFIGFGQLVKHKTKLPYMQLLKDILSGTAECLLALCTVLYTGTHVCCISGALTLLL